MTDAKTHSSLRDAAFRAPENHATPASSSTVMNNPLIKKVKVYAVPADKATDAEVMKAFHVYLIASGAGKDENRHLWQNYLATLVCGCFPFMKTGILQHAMFEEEILSEPMVKSISDWYDYYQAATDPDAPAELTKGARTTLEQLIIDLQIPRPKIAYDVNLADVSSVESIYGHVSIVLFLAGKTITEANRLAVTQKRPGAIERKYFNGTVVGSLSGSLQLSTVAHGQIHSAFTALTPLRKEVFTKVAQFNNMPSDTTIEIVATTTRLMRYAGMQQAIMIDAFLSAHEEAFDIPLLMPAIQAYSASMRDLMAAPAEQRPYYKLIHGDTTRAFNRNDLTNLVVVAVNEVRDTNPTAQNYNIPANHQLIMDKYYKTLAARAAMEDEAANQH